MCPYTPRVQVCVEPRLSAARRAREFVRQHTCTRHASNVVDVALLLVSELVTNAVRHGRPPIRVEMDCEGEHSIAVRVHDGGASLPAVIDLTTDVDPSAEGGRGLAIVQALSDSWGVTGVDGGKAVWFRLDPTAAGQGRGDLSAAASA
ncbi:MAG: ATP-binding protein [Kineosporiaceae bacterium]